MKQNTALLGLLKIPVSPLQEEKLARIDSEDYSGTRKKAKEILISQGLNPSEEYLDLGILGLRLYYALPVLDPLNGHAISAEIDPFWHAHMLHARQYAKFGQELLGGPIDHVPLDRENSDQLENVRTLYEYTVEILTRIFGEDALDRRVWPIKVADLKLVCLHYAAPENLELERAAQFPVSTGGRVWAFS